MKKLKIGVVDLDTSHPGAWVPILRELGHEVVGVFDGGTVYPTGYADEFAKERSIPRVFSSLSEMAEAVDLAIVHSCNWDLHVERATPFIEAGKAVLIDKPMAGNLSDIQQLLEWERKGALITGGSSLRYAAEARSFLDGLEADETIRYVYSGCGVDEFNYGIHAYALVQAILGAGVTKAQHLAGGKQHQIALDFESGARAILTVGNSTKWLPFFATVITDRRINQIAIDNRKIYRSMLEKVLPYLAGESEAPVPFADLVEVEKAALAARQSWRNNDAVVFLQDLGLEDSGYEGAAFAASYRLSKL